MEVSCVFDFIQGNAIVLFCAMAAGAFVLDGRRKVR